MDDDYQLAEKLQAEEQQDLIDAEKATLFICLIELLKGNTFVDYKTELVVESSKKAEAEVMKGSSKKAGTELEQESSKKQKIDDDKKHVAQEFNDNMLSSYYCWYKVGATIADKEVSDVGEVTTANIATTISAAVTVTIDEITLAQELMEIKTSKSKSKWITLQEPKVAIDAIPLAVKSVRIVDWKIHKVGKKRYYKIIRAKGKSKMYLVFSHMLKEFDRKDLKDLYNLIKSKYGSTRPVKDLDLILWGDLKTMFEPHVEDEVWKTQQRYNVVRWTLYDSCRVHCLSLQSGHVYMLVKVNIAQVKVSAAQEFNENILSSYCCCKVNAASTKLMLLRSYNCWNKVSIKRLMDENPSVASNVGNMAMDTFNDDTLYVDDPLIVQKVVETVSTRFANTLYGYFLGKQSLTMGIPLIDDSGFTIDTVSIEYEGKPPCCDLCRIFSHVQDRCPKKVSVLSTIVTSTVGSVKSGSLGSMAMDTPNLVDTMNIDEPPNVHSVSIQEKPSSYVGAAGGSKLIP
nr:hypothetical protein [Tanacetum cinerariifolium]